MQPARLLGSTSPQILLISSACYLSLHYKQDLESHATLYLAATPGCDEGTEV